MKIEDFRLQIERQACTQLTISNFTKRPIGNLKSSILNNLMWFCANCRNEMEDKYRHCWKCGAKRAVGVRPPSPRKAVNAVPQFASYEELAKVPKQQPFILRLFLLPNPLRRPLIVLVMFGLLKFFGSPLLGKYGLYVVIVGGILGLIFVLWGHFRRDPSEGVGIKLN